MKGITVALLFALLLSGAVELRGASTITAASCNVGDVRADRNGESAGDTVAIPPGTCCWATPIWWGAPPNVFVRGAGNLQTLGGGDATVLVDDYPGSSPLFAFSSTR